jgi:hypothetical protein
VCSQERARAQAAVTSFDLSEAEPLHSRWSGSDLMNDRRKADPSAEGAGTSSISFRPVPIRSLRARLAMTKDRTEAGTPIVEFDEDEYRAFLEREVERGSGLSVEEFVRRYEAGDLDEGDPDVSDLASLLWLGQNGHRVAA